MSAPRQILLIGQLGFLLFLAVCIGLIPRGLSANDGICYYGTQNQTLIPFALSIGSIIVSSFVFGKRIWHERSLRPIAYVYFLLPVLLLAVTITPYDYSKTFHFIHVAVTILIFVVQMLLAIWILVARRWDSINIALLLLMAIEGLVSLYYVGPAHGLLLQAETAFQVTFAGLVYKNLQL